MPPVDAPEKEARAHVVPRSGRLALIFAGISVFFVVLMLAVSFQGIPHFTPPPYMPPGGERFPEPVPSATDAAPPELPVIPDSPMSSILGIIVVALLSLALAVFAFFAIRRLIRVLIDMWRSRPTARRSAGEVQGGATASVAVPEPDEHVIRRGIEAALQTIDERSASGDSIIAAWVGLEETSADAGAARQPSETPAEFTLRVVGRRRGAADELATLLGLYERVRFGGYQADDSDRATAASCLRRIQEEWR